MTEHNKDLNILVTGGAGFVGSNFIPFFLEEYPNHKLVNLDKLTYAGSLSNLEEAAAFSNYVFVQGDICDKALLKEVFDTYSINAVIHFAAESHVDNSINSPENFISSNIQGTFALLEQARASWQPRLGDHFSERSHKRFHHISTDEVYGTLGMSGYFNEDTPYAPNSPYSASKAAADFLVRSYHHTYGLNTVTSNCSNNYGPKQHDEKLIPTIIRKALDGAPIPIYGTGKNIRDWLYVVDHCKAVRDIFFRGKAGQTYVVGAQNEYNNLAIAKKICVLLDAMFPEKKSSFTAQITFVEDRPGHDLRYAINPTRIQEELSWSAEEDFDTGLVKTIEWYVNKYQSK